ncbi:Tubulin-specific chaperone A [Nakaseomyces bracarensis]|uniref:Tubulin-specific chaperone A n=1 Tax=Nakaseomyces bracarensis TaxID=273131 RepID=A0ABR4NSK7_9SACH
MAPTQLEIKVKALQRLVKEEKYYLQELKDQQKHVKKLKADSSVDKYDLKKQEEVLNDTERLLPTLYVKIKEFMDNLEEYLESYTGAEDTKEAKEAIESAKKILSKH